MQNKELPKVKVETTKTAVAAGEKENLVQKIQNIVDENSKIIIGISIGLIVVVIAFFVIKGRIDKTNEENRQMASVAVARILPYLQANDYQKALYGDPTKRIRNQKVIGLIEIIKEYGGTKQAEYASLYAGSCFLSLNKNKEALEYFDKALGSSSKVIKEGAAGGLAVCYENLGNYRDAADYYEKASKYSLTPGMKSKYHFFEALCREKTGEKDIAEKLYREIIYDNQSEYVGPAKSGLIRLGTIIE